MNETLAPEALVFIALLARLSFPFQEVKRASVLGLAFFLHSDHFGTLNHMDESHGTASGSPRKDLGTIRYCAPSRRQVHIHRMCHMVRLMDEEHNGSVLA